jgi:hypothetical protein
VTSREIAGLFWIATAIGRFDRVTITGLDRPRSLCRANAALVHDELIL